MKNEVQELKEGILSSLDPDLLIKLVRYGITITPYEAEVALKSRLSGENKARIVVSDLPKKRSMSAAGRRRISKAQKKRWAEHNSAKAPAVKRKKMSKAGRRAISAAQKKRWAVLKSGNAANAA